MIIATRLSVHSPPADSARPLRPTATATAVACTTAAIDALPTADTTIPRSADSCVSLVVALTSSGSAPPNSCQPMRLRASAKPIATACDIVVLAATATASAATVAAIVDEFSVVSRITPSGAPPLAVTALPAIQALALPPIVLTAVAPPPLKARLDFSPTATVIADAVEVASIAAFCSAVTTTLPPTARADAIASMDA